ncbi:polysaccharide biosynthesis protein [Claveliimonas bilis]|uniref:lipopolysaccharide biosynthesis protein n=1 Tax=Claveliimonas bilis TaxID=3028070 RepID=UPI001E2BA76A|nr:oligosaccharide flippase family protein [Claveliimonas bilis]BCZ28025.1 polysaccharide biosynthesis protein [Claveliimonas bilis]
MLKKLISNYKQLSNPVKAAFWFTICNLLLKGISLITVPIFTRMLSEIEYGKLSLFVSYEQFFLILSTWEIQNGAYQKGIFKYKDNIKNYTAATISLVNLLTVAFFCIIFLLITPISNFTQISADIFIVLCVYFIVRPAYDCWLIRQRTEYKYKNAVILTLLYSLANVFIPICALKVIGETAQIKYVSGLIISILICLGFYVFSLVPLKSIWKDKKRTVEQWSFMLRFEGPLVLHSLSYLILNQSDRVMIGKLVGNAQAAYYSIAYNLSTVIVLFQNSINQALLPWRYQMLEEKKYKQMKEVNTNLLIIFAMGILLFILICPEIMRVLFTENYYEAVWCIPPISLSVYFMFLYTIFVNIETYFEKTQYVMYVSGTCSIINIILNYFGIIYFGYISCAYATLVSYILFSIGHYYFMKRTLEKNDIKSSEIVDSKMLIFISILIIIITILFICLYNYYILRWAVIGMLVLLIVMKREKIYGILTMVRGEKE